MTDRETERRNDGTTDGDPERREGSLSVTVLSVVPSFRLSVLLLMACQASTTRPTYGPLPGAATAEVHLGPAQATRVLAQALMSDSITLKFVHDGDGVLVSEWLTVPGYQATRDRPLGPGFVRVRAWVDLGVISQADTASVLTVETAYRVYADPSREERELEQPVAETHPARIKVAKLLTQLVKLYGDVAADSTTAPATTPPP